MQIKIKYFNKLILLSLLLTSFFRNVNAQDSTTVHLGDPAPAFKYSKWIQGTPITSLEKDKMYVIEFWATWCGPCIQAMPHLSELSKKYAGKVKFIGCNVWEGSHDKAQINYDKYLPKVIRFVKEQKKMGRLTYNVIADDNAQHMGNGWLKVAGIDGIPSSFIIQKGKIAWIGHPVELDSILTAIQAGTYDIDAVIKEKKEQQAKDAKTFGQMNDFKKAYADAETAKDYSKAIHVIDSAVEAMPPFKFVFMTDKFRILLDHFGEDQAIAYGREVEKGIVGVQSIALYLYERKDLSQKMKEFNSEIADHLKPDYAMILNIQAELQARAGYWTKAVETQKKAIDLANVQKSDPNLAGYLTESVIAGYKEKLTDYQKKTTENK
jgi:thiol-disulfide isomerase/thioredoxin